VIDLDLMDAQLAAASRDVAHSRRPAVRSAPVPAPTPAPASDPLPRARQRPSAPPPAAGVVELLESGQLDVVDVRIEATSDPRDRLTWTTMRDLLAGRSTAAGDGIRQLADLGRAGDAEAAGRAWVQRFWAACEWGTEAERYDVLDHCRERAYRFDDVAWWGNLTLLLATMGKGDEAVRAFDSALPMAAGEATRLDVVTNLVEAAALLGDAGRVSTAGRHLRAPAVRLVVVGAGVLCKGSADRYAGLVHAAQGQHAKATECFRRAEELHRAIGAIPLLARTRRLSSTLAAA
jgi:tetratricopeptide (TPR) repeat protein